MKRTDLDDAAYGRWVREQNKVRAERQRERLAGAGLKALTVWVPATLREDLAALAEGRGMKFNSLAVEVFKAGMVAINPAPAPVPAKTGQPVMVPIGSRKDQDGLMQEVDALVAQGLGYAAICREFNTAGRTTARGAQFRSSDLARAHQRWKTRSTSKEE